MDSPDIRDTHTGWSCYTNNAAALVVVMADEVFDGTDVVRQLFREGESVTGHVTDVHFGLAILHDLVGVTAGAKHSTEYHVALLLKKASAWHGEW